MVFWWGRFGGISGSWLASWSLPLRMVGKRLLSNFTFVDARIPGVCCKRLREMLIIGGFWFRVIYGLEFHDGGVLDITNVGLVYRACVQWHRQRLSLAMNTRVRYLFPPSCSSAL